MAGRDEQVVAAQQLGAGDQAVFVDGQRQQVAGVAGEDIARVGIAGVFHADHGIVVDQQVGQQVERVLRAHGDDDLDASAQTPRRGSTWVRICSISAGSSWVMRSGAQLRMSSTDSALIQHSRHSAVGNRSWSNWP